ncbi:MAG: hypothetical protein ACM3TR_09725 [Caulobacteraceae bacterium]
MDDRSKLLEERNERLLRELGKFDVLVEDDIQSRFTADYVRKILIWIAGIKE